jgi:DNA polymerase I-like protein with 3'-5' exonuclease and polymerase domains
MLRLSVDTEVGGVDLWHSARPFLVTICSEEQQLYWEWDVDPLTRKPSVPKGDLLEIAGWLDKADLLVFQNAKYDIRGLIQVGLKWKRAWWPKVNDTLFSGHLLASGEPHNLTAMVLKYLYIDITPYEQHLAAAVQECRKRVVKEFPTWRIAKAGDPGMPSAKQECWRNDYWLPRAYAKAKGLPADHPYWSVCSEYANVDSSCTLALWERHEQLLKTRGLWNMYLERRKLVKVINNMEHSGVTYCENRRQELNARLTKEELTSEEACIQLSGGKLEALPKNGTTNALRDVLFNHFHLEPIVIRRKGKKTDTPTVDKFVLEHWIETLEPKHPAIPFLKNLRLNRSRNTALGYSESYKRFGITLEGNWVLLHPSLNATGSDTLRFTSANPNEQNISKLSDTNLRYIFGPRKGREWWSLDYSNLELTIPAYEANEQEMIQLFERPNDPPYFGSQHLLISHLLYPKEFEGCLRDGVSFKDRYKASLYQWVKNGDFAVTYGAMIESGTADLAYHLPGAQLLIESHFTNIAKLNKKQIAFANSHGFVWTMPDKELGAYPIQVGRTNWGSIRPTTPLNYHVQGTAMQCMCRAMVRVAEYLEANVPGGYITMQVHDELVLDLPFSPQKAGGNTEVIMEVKRLMELSGDDIGVPLRVGIAYHPNNWSKDEEFEEITAC